ncbi:MAG: sulfatase [Planctomycetota bacterium]|nr:MAG: sulfatase [Planctomycetota bacterium]
MFATACFLFAVSLPLTQAQLESEQDLRPNIILFLVDDLGWQDTSVPMAKEAVPQNRHFRTPQLQRLAQTGVRFEQAYAAAVCSPTRTSLMTGQNPARHRVTNWTLKADRDQSGKTARLQSPDWRNQGLQPGEPTLPALLQQAGYFTIHAGKAHWGADQTPGEDPCNLGFDRNIAGHCAGAPGHYAGQHDFGFGKDIWGVPGLADYHGLPIHLSDALTVEACKAVREAVDREQPFYLYMAHYAVHAPIRAHPPYDQAYLEAGVDAVESRYASMVEGVDASLGALLACVERLGVGERTLVMFASDNGGLSVHARGKARTGSGDHSHNWPLREGKGSAYEGGTRIPQVISWAVPAADHPLQRRLPVEAGAIRQTPTIVEDYFPTLLAWAGVPLPENHPLDGMDFTPLLQRDDLGEDRPLLFHYPHVWGPKGPGYQPHSAMRLGPWKVIYFYQPQRWELYRLDRDLGEKKDLAKKQAEVLRRMARRMVSELEARKAQYPRLRQGGTEEAPVLP